MDSSGGGVPGNRQVQEMSQAVGCELVERKCWTLDQDNVVFGKITRLVLKGFEETSVHNVCWGDPGRLGQVSAQVGAGEPRLTGVQVGQVA